MRGGKELRGRDRESGADSLRTWEAAAMGRGEGGNKGGNGFERRHSEERVSARAQPVQAREWKRKEPFGGVCRDQRVSAEGWQIPVSEQWKV